MAAMRTNRGGSRDETSRCVECSGDVDSFRLEIMLVMFHPANSVALFSTGGSDCERQLD